MPPSPHPSHPSRRAFLHTGLAAVGAMLALPASRAAGAASRLSSLATHSNLAGWGGTSSAFGDLSSSPLYTPVPASAPILRLNGFGGAGVGPIEHISGLPFSPVWYGDEFPSGGLPFHVPESPRQWATLDEHVDVVVIGGGLSGLATARALMLGAPADANGSATRGGKDWVLFELRSRMGGVASGESWNRIPYSLGSAYFMVPDKGDAFDQLYTDLGVWDHARVDKGTGFQLEYQDAIIQDLCQGCSPEEQKALQAYQAAVQVFANRAYPNIPWANDRERAYAQQLDQQTFRGAVEQICGRSIPPLLHKSLQAYCYSSFGVGWDELSAAAGWNFIAAEEFGRIVLPGGNAGLATMLWNDLVRAPLRPNGRARMRAGCMVTDIKLVPQGVMLAWRDPTGRTHTMGARHVVYTGPKHVFRHMMQDISEIDPDKSDAMNSVFTVPYVVANVLLNTRVPRDFYDLFLVHDRAFPDSPEACQVDRRITDAVYGGFAVARSHAEADVLTLYWPLPWHTSRFTVVQEAQWRDYATLGAPQIGRMLSVLGMAPHHVECVRLARWGHAMAYAPIGTYSGDLCPTLRRPVADRIWFASQDTWMLPAVETCLTEAWWVAKQIG